MKSRLLAVAVLAIFAVSCATGSIIQNYAFKPSDDKAMVILHLPYEFADVVQFHGVDPDTKEFVRKIVRMPVSGFLSTKLKAPGHIRAGKRGFGNFYASKAAPGKYAYVQYVKMTRERGGTVNVVNCFSKKTSVYEFLPGKINLVSVSGPGEVLNLGGRSLTIPAGKAIEKDQAVPLLKELLAHYPSIEGDIVFSEPVEKISFNAGTSFWSAADCPKGKSYEVLENNSE